jgi:hypothetical protein
MPVNRHGGMVAQSASVGSFVASNHPIKYEVQYGSVQFTSHPVIVDGIQGIDKTLSGSIYIW